MVNFGNFDAITKQLDLDAEDIAHKTIDDNGKVNTSQVNLSVDNGTSKRLLTKEEVANELMKNTPIEQFETEEDYKKSLKDDQKQPQLPTDIQARLKKIQEEAVETAKVSQQKQAELDAKNKSLYSESDKEGVLLSFILDAPFTKEYKIGLGSTKTYNIELKTLTTREQKILNDKFDSIVSKGELLESSISYGNNVQQTTQFRALSFGSEYEKRVATFAAHLSKFGTKTITSVEEAEKILSNMNKRFFDVVYVKCLDSFLGLVDEACSEVNVF